GNLFAFREDDLHLNAGDSGGQRQVLELLVIYVASLQIYVASLQTAPRPTPRHQPSAPVAAGAPRASGAPFFFNLCRFAPNRSSAFSSPSPFCTCCSRRAAQVGRAFFSPN